MITERLYYDNAYLTEFDGVVTEVRPDGWAALDRSAFYPASGGQPFDTGVWTLGDRTLRISDVQVENGVVWHKTDGEIDLGTAVHGRIDWPRRWDHMQQHAADHMLAGAAWQMWQAVTIGLHVGRENSTIDLDFLHGRTHLTDEELNRWENLVNERVQQDDPIRCWFPAADELASLPLRKAPTVTEHIRIVAMGDYEMVACGGTHPSTTGQIGPVKILGAAPARGKMRLSFVAGMRAVRYFQQCGRCASRISAALSCDVPGAYDALMNERKAQAEVRRDLNERLLLAAIQSVTATGQNDLYVCHVPFADAALLTRAASEIVDEEENGVVLLSCPHKNGRMLVFAAGKQAQSDMAALMRACGVKGGGKPDFAQGMATDDQALRRAAAIIAK